MNKRIGILAFVCAAAFAACGGGGGGGTGGGGGGGVPVIPTPTPTPTPAGNLPLSETVAGAAAWVSPSSHRTLYSLDNDTATGGKCTSANGCLAIWPIFAAAAGSVNTDNMTVVTRGDGAGQQWAYQGHLLYTYTGDSAADQANGEGITEPDGGKWHVARPASAGTVTPPPGDPTCHGYC